MFGPSDQIEQFPGVIRCGECLARLRDVVSDMPAWRVGLVLADLFQMTLLEDMVADGYIRQFEHNNGDLVGYN